MAIGGFWVMIYASVGFYVEVFRKSRIKEFFLVIGLSILGTIILFFTVLIDDPGIANYQAYYKTAGTYFLIHVGMALCIKMVSLSYLKRLIRKKKVWFNTLIVGSNTNAQEILKDILSINNSLGYKFLGYVHIFEDSKDLLSGELRHFGDYENIPKLIRRCKIEHIIIAVESSEHQKIAEILNAIEGTNVRVSIIPDIYQILLGSVKVNHVFGIPLIEINRKLIPVWQKVFKRGFDIVFSISLLILGFPFLLFFALMTKFSSKGPMFYTQERIGKDEIPFNIIKFRSMYVGSEKKGPALSSDNDPRITKWGKFMRKTRIDELPQVINVLKGDMAVVGPRPERQYFINKIVEQAPHYKHLLRVRPGITSLGQVKYGYAENVDEMVRRLKYDIIYIENMSLAMDFRILVFTFLIIFQGRGK